MTVLRRRPLQHGGHAGTASAVCSTGTLMALLSAGCFGTSGTFATALLRAGWSPLAAVTVRIALAALALSAPAALAARRAPGWWRRGGSAIGLYGLVAVAGCQLCYFEAVQHLSVAVALLLEYSGTVLVVGWNWARHHQRPGVATAVGGALAVVGLAFVLGVVGGGAHLDAAGVAWGLGAAVGNAGYFVLAGATTADGPPALVVAWGGMATGAAAMAAVALSGALPWAAPRRIVVLAGARTSWLVPVLGLSMVAAAFAYVVGIGATRRLGARVASFVGLTEVLFASGYAALVIGEHLGALQLLGGALVLAGIVAVRLDPDPAPVPLTLEAALPPVLEAVA